MATRTQRREDELQDARRGYTKTPTVTAPHVFQPNIYTPTENEPQNTSSYSTEDYARLRRKANRTGYGISGERKLEVVPGGTQTNFPTGREGEAPIAAHPISGQPMPSGYTNPEAQRIAEAQYYGVKWTPRQSPTAPTIAPVAETPFNAYATDVELRNMAAGEAGLSADNISDTAKRLLAMQAREGGTRGTQAQQKLRDLGITASTAELLGKTNEITRAEIQMAITNPQLLAPSKRNIIQKDIDRRVSIMKEQRDIMLAEEISQFEKTEQDLKLNKLELDVQRIGLDILKEERDWDLNREIMEAELEALQERTKKSAADMERQEKIDAILRDEKRPVSAITSTTQDITGAQSLKDIKSTIPDIASVGVLYGVAKETINILNSARLAASYQNPLELAQRITGQTYEEGFGTLKGSAVREYTESAQDAIKSGLSIDNAVKAELATLSPKDKNYKQIALTVSTAFLSEYMKQGEERLTAAKEQIAQRKAEVRQNVVKPELDVVNQSADQPATAIEVLNGGISAHDKAMRKSQIAKAAGGQTGQLVPFYEGKALQEFGYSQLEQQTTEQITQNIITFMEEKHKDNTAIVASLEQLREPSDRSPEEIEAFGMITARLQSGIKTAQMEYEDKVQKASLERKGIEESVKKDNPTALIQFADDPTSTDYIVFLDPNLHDEWKNADTQGRAEIAKLNEDDIRRAIIGRDGNEAYQRLPDDYKKVVYQLVNIKTMSKTYQDKWLYDNGFDLSTNEPDKLDAVIAATNEKFFTDQVKTWTPREAPAIPPPQGTREEHIQMLQDIMAGKGAELSEADKTKVRAKLEEFGAPLPEAPSVEEIPPEAVKETTGLTPDEIKVAESTLPEPDDTSDAAVFHWIKNEATIRSLQMLSKSIDVSAYGAMRDLSNISEAYYRWIETNIGKPGRKAIWKKFMDTARNAMVSSQESESKE